MVILNSGEFTTVIRIIAALVKFSILDFELLKQSIYCFPMFASCIFRNKAISHVVQIFPYTTTSGTITPTLLLSLCSYGNC